MFLGADVYHPRPTTSTDTEEILFAPSVAAVCIQLQRVVGSPVDFAN